MGTATTPMQLDLASDESLELGIRLSRGARRLIRDLVRARGQRGCSQSQVADAIGIHRSGVTRFERQETNPTLDTILRYAQAVGAEINFHVEPLGGWECEDSMTVTRLSTWKAGADSDDGIDTWNLNGQIRLAR